MDHSDRIVDLVESLTRAEKLALVHGAPDPDGTATGYLPGVDRLGVPELKLADGPLGVRTPGQAATAFPASIALAATFDDDLARRQGAAIGREANARGQDVLLGPGLNLIRVPHCGRNFEYFSEDPVLTGSFAGAVVEGLQSEDVVATPKHFVANNQETRRTRVSADVSERALRECYLPGFRAAVDAGAGAIMTAYNQINGTHASEHHRLLTEVLKGEWGFEGFVMSDWFGTETTVGAANAGLDLEMPGITSEEMMESFDMPDLELSDIDFGNADALPTPETAGTRMFAEPLDEAIDAGDVPEARLDDMVARILGQMERFGVLDDERNEGEIDTPEHREIAEEVATRGTVLLENDGVLPLDDDADVAVVGPAATVAMLGGGGSSEMTAFDETPTVDGIRERAGGTVTYAQGVPEIEIPSFFDDIFGDDEAATDADADTDSASVAIDDAVEAAESAEVAVVVVQDATTEAEDRDDLRLPGDQDALVEAVAAANDRTVVVVQSSGPVELPWRDDVAAVVESWYPGQADGDAVASVLYGDADAGGRLPVTFAPESEYPATEPHQYPGDDEVHYDEGVFVGYRHFDDTDAEPTYPFGHGLSYAEFAYRDVEMVDDETVRVTVENTSERDGREVVQAYVRPPHVADVERPLREFAGHTAVDIPAGESVTVDVTLDDLAFRRYDESDGWTVDPGAYGVEVGRSSRDVRAETGVSR
ncbi:beta-glucosidase [Halomicrobium zhouii]|uniref:Beta-glucosidase n=1 Tax=Halomicrobium zhouii TaxID=767519 RepID=A0A1I6LZF0_9EURY|nr:glycoside hydrolase family 3 C-terminal domain-containing protein [Halomicrobium zhouii]SFS08754.1 beta-glucosidase [Halomicrobium zhouii]